MLTAAPGPFELQLEVTRRDHRVVVFGGISSNLEEKLKWLEREWEWRVIEDNPSAGPESSDATPDGAPDCDGGGI